MKKICIVVSVPMTIKAFLLKHIKVLSTEYEITIVSNSHLDLGKEYEIKCLSKYIPIDRKINLISDIKNIYKLYNFFKKEKFDLIFSVTPKAGLISSISGFFARVNKRVHFFTGQVWVTKKGIFRILLKSIDKLIGKLNTNNLIDSPSQREFLIVENVLKQENSKVLLSGSISGVDIDKFYQDESLKKSLQKKFHLNEGEIIFMFIGRLNIDKGILDLTKVFDILLKKYDNIKLFIVGADEENIEEKIYSLLNNKNVIRLDYVSNPQEILNIADVLVLPSYREGFGTIVIEAAAMGVPCIASNIYGLKDAVIDKYTGWLHQVKDIDEMLLTYEHSINNIQEIKKFGENSQKRVYEEFQDKLLSRELKLYIDGLMQND